MLSCLKNTVIIVATVLILTGCEKKVVELYAQPHDGIIIASVKDGKELGERYQIATVNAISFSDDLDFNGSEGDVIATADFINGSFTMELPATVSDEFLKKFNNKYGKISNQNAKLACVTFFKAYDKEGVHVGYLEYISNKKYWYPAYFWYTDSDITLTYRSDFSLKRGWNIQYESEEAHNDMKWEFYQ